MKDAKALLVMLGGALGLSALFAPRASATVVTMKPTPFGFSVAGSEPQPTVTSPRGIAFIKMEEGFLSTPKLDVTKLSIGYGHNFVFGDGFTSKSVITMQQGHDLLLKDLKSREAAVRNSVRVPITQNMFDALVSLAYNIGEGKLAKSTLIDRLNAGDYQGARDQFHVWNKVGTTVHPVLVGRRAREANLFATRG